MESYCHRACQRRNILTTRLLNDRDIEFLLYEVPDTEALLQRSRYHKHSREIFDSTLETARVVAEK